MKIKKHDVIDVLDAVHTSDSSRDPKDLERLAKVLAGLRSVVDEIERQYKDERAALLAELDDKKRVRDFVKAFYEDVRSVALSILRREYEAHRVKTFGSLQIRVKKKVRLDDQEDALEAFDGCTWNGQPLVTYKPVFHEKAILEYVEWLWQTGRVDEEFYRKWVETEYSLVVKRDPGVDVDLTFEDVREVANRLRDGGES